MTMTAEAHRIDGLGGIRCLKCDAVIEKIVLKGAERPKAVLFRKCKECHYYNVVDLEFLSYS